MSFELRFKALFVVYFIDINSNTIIHIILNYKSLKSIHSINFTRLNGEINNSWFFISIVKVCESEILTKKYSYH